MQWYRSCFTRERMQPSIPLVQRRSTTQRAPLRLDSRVNQAELEWVLLLDDDLVTARSVSRWVKRAVGMETRAARTVHQAVCWLSSMPSPVAIVTDFDLQMGETGASALASFRATGQLAPAIVLTGAPTRARSALDETGLTDIAVLSKTQFQQELQQWLIGQREWKRSA